MGTVRPPMAGSRREHSNEWLAFFLLFALSIAAGGLHADERRWNVLLIVADDLRVELGCYGSIAKTPRIDGLAAKSLRFDRAYCQQAVCNPSRSSFLTSRRPDSLGLWSNGIHFREVAPDVVTLPEHFKAQGYTTRCVGKIFHNWHTQEKGDRRSWSADEFLHYANHGNDKPEVTGDLPPDLATAPRCEIRDVPDEAYYDGRVAAEAERVIASFGKEPFFLAVGFWKPHAPFNAPKRYWDLYREADIPTVVRQRPENAPDIAFHDGRELRGIPPNQITFDDAQLRQIRHGYFANISYLDAQVGRVLDAMERAKLLDSTVIVFLGDHGYHLGEHDLWGKTSNFEYDARVPLMISLPAMKHAGSRTTSLVELLDVYPTLVDLCHLPLPKALEGVSLKPILDVPETRVKEAAFTQHPRPAYFDREPSKLPAAMGYSVRTDQWRYTEWRDWKTGKVAATELYDHRSDPAETRNVSVFLDSDATAQDARMRLHRQFPPR